LKMCCIMLHLACVRVLSQIGDSYMSVTYVKLGSESI
jgi:hypothetical protein